MRALNNSALPGYTAKAQDHASPEYAERVAGPVMQAVDAMPKAYRDLANEYGYIEVFLAWRRGVSANAIIYHAMQGSLKSVLNLN